MPLRRISATSVNHAFGNEGTQHGQPVFFLALDEEISKGVLLHDEQLENCDDDTTKQGRTSMQAKTLPVTLRRYAMFCWQTKSVRANSQTVANSVNRQG